MIFSRALLISMIVSLLSGCAYQAYDPKDPDEYEKYWKKEENRRNSIFYPITQEGRGGK